MVKNLSAPRETWIQSLHWESPWSRKRQPAPVFFVFCATAFSEIPLTEEPGGPQFVGCRVGHDWAGDTHRDKILSAVIVLGSPGGSDSKNPPAMRETWFQSLGWEDSLEEGMATHSSILACTIPMDRETWLVTVHGVAKSWTWLSN